MPGELVPILIVLTVCAYLGWRRYLQHQERIAAIQRGMDPQMVLREAGKTSGKKGSHAPKDHRLGSLVLIASGLAYAVAVFFSVGVYTGMERAVAAAVWGLLPLAIGAARYAYEASRPNDEALDRHRRAAFVLTSAGLAYMVCITLSVGILRGAERAVAAGVWGIIPLAIGVALFIYSGMVRKERRDQGQQGAS
jgi:cadmium resistance protein CadD (predicted permease)